MTSIFGGDIINVHYGDTLVEGDLEVTGILNAESGFGNIVINGDALVIGDLEVKGSIISKDQLIIDDSLFELNATALNNLNNIGWFGLFIQSGSKYTGLAKDWTSQRYKLFDNETVIPTSSSVLSATGILDVKEIGTPLITTGGALSITSNDITIGDYSISMVEAFSMTNLTLQAVLTLNWYSVGFEAHFNGSGNEITHLQFRPEHIGTWTTTMAYVGLWDVTSTTLIELLHISTSDPVIGGYYTKALSTPYSAGSSHFRIVITLPGTTSGVGQAYYFLTANNHSANIDVTMDGRVETNVVNASEITEANTYPVFMSSTNIIEGGGFLYQNLNSNNMIISTSGVTVNSDLKSENIKPLSNNFYSLGTDVLNYFNGYISNLWSPVINCGQIFGVAGTAGTGYIDTKTTMRINYNIEMGGTGKEIGTSLLPLGLLHAISGSIQTISNVTNFITGTGYIHMTDYIKSDTALIANNTGSAGAPAVTVGNTTTSGLYSTGTALGLTYDAKSSLTTNESYTTIMGDCVIRKKDFANGTPVDSNLYSLIADATVANTTTPTDLLILPPAAGSFGYLTIPANTLSAGDQLRLSVFGNVQTTGSPSLTIQIYLGLNVVAFGTHALTGLTQEFFDIEAAITIRATTVMCTGCFNYVKSSSQSFSLAPVGWSPIVVDFSLNNQVRVVATWSIANAGNIITAQNATLISAAF